MGFEKSHTFGKVEVDIRASVAGTIVFETETPGQTLGVRFTMPVPITNGRTVLKSRLPGNMQGHFVKSTGTPGTAPNGHWELYGVRVWSRQLPDGQWSWFPLPVMDTPVEFIAFPILEDATAAGGATVGFSEFKLPVEPTPEMFQEFKLPVEPTPETFSPLELPVQATPADFSLFNFPVQATSEDFSLITLPVEPTPAEFSLFQFPVKPTPPVPMWVPVQVDE